MAKRIEDFMEQAMLIVAANIVQIPFAIADFKWAMQADSTINFCGSVAGLTATNNFLVEHKDVLIQAVALELLVEYNSRLCNQLPMPLAHNEAMHIYLGKWLGLSGRHIRPISKAQVSWYIAHNVPLQIRCKKVPHKGGVMHKQYYISSWAW
jgi:hypothetical protein